MLLEPFVLDRKGEVPPGKQATYPLPIFHDFGGHISALYARSFVRAAQARPETPRLTPQQEEAMDMVDCLAASDELRLDMDFRPGDMQFLHNHQIDRPARAPKGAEGLRGRFWNVLRKLKKTDVAQLVTMAGAGNEKNPEHNARLYLKALTDAGYLTRMKRRGPHGEMTYALVRDSGPRAPIVSHRKQTVTDPNNGEVHHV